MNDATPPQRKVVRRVVKKTVVRPASGTAPVARRTVTTRPAVSTVTRPAAGDPGTTSRETEPATSDVAVVDRAAATPERTVERPFAPKPRKPRPSPGAVLRGARDRVADTGLWFVDRFHDGKDWTADRADDAVDRLRSWEVAPQRATTVTGAVFGLVAVGLGALALESTSGLRNGTAGGSWGLATFVALCAATILLSGRVLKALRVPNPHIVALLGTLLTVAAILVFFIDAGQSPWMALIIPALMAGTYPGSWWLVETAQSDPAETSPAESILPEPEPT